MHTLNDTRTRDNTLRLYTGHSRRFLRVRAWVRAALCIVPITAAYAHYLAS